VISILPRELQIEVISSLPGLSSDKGQGELVTKLQELIEQNNDLVPCVMETVANLGLPAGSASLNRIVLQAQEHIKTVDLAVLPALVNFLLEVCNDDNTSAILSSLRLAFKDFLSASTDASGAERQTRDSTNALLIGILKTAFSNKPKLFENFQKDLLQYSKSGMLEDCENQSDRQVKFPV
jgi:Fanconi anaemia protein FancD2 nuclease